MAELQCACGECSFEWFSRGWNCPGVRPVCPICFDASQPAARYAVVSNHSWENMDRCDAHGLCWSCLQQYIEIKILDEGRWNLACPGIGCKYHLVSDDIDLILTGSSLREKTLLRYKSLCSESGTSRLQNALNSALRNREDSWMLSSLQACPKCFILAQRHDGCQHLVCRCGCHFCFGCGSAHGDFVEIDGEQIRCLCPYIDDVQLGAWLAFKGCEASLMKYLAQLAYHAPTLAAIRHQRRMREASRVVRVEESFRFSIGLLSSWLWLAGADVEPPMDLPHVDPHEDYAVLATEQPQFDIEYMEMDISDLDVDDSDRCSQRITMRIQPRKVRKSLYLSSSKKGTHCAERSRPATEVRATKTHNMRQRQRQRWLHTQRREKMFFVSD